MELTVYLWVEDVIVFIRELIHFLNEFFPENKVVYTEKYDSLDNVMDRDIFLVGTGIWIVITDDDDLSYLSEEYGTKVNLDLWFNIVTSMYDEASIYVAEMVNWMMRTSDTDLAIENECSWLIFKRMKGKIFYAKTCESFPYDYFPGDTLNYDKAKAFGYTKDDKWVFCSEEHIQKMERWRKKKEKLEESD